MLPSLTVLPMVVVSLFTAMTLMPIQELRATNDNTEISVVSDIILEQPIVTGAYCDLDIGTITILVQGGVDVDLEYSIDGGFTWNSSNYFDGLSEGDYLIRVRRISDPTCIVTTSLQVPDANDLTIETLTFECQAGANTASYMMTVDGGTAEYTISYNDPNGGVYDAVSFDTNIPFEINNIVQGNYTIFLEDRLGCVKDTTIFVEECCTFNYICDNDPLILDCLDELPAIDSVYLDGVTTGYSDLDSLESQNILAITDNCFEATVKAEDIQTNTPTSCIGDTLKIERTYTIDQNGTLYTCVQPIYVLYFGTPSIVDAQPMSISCEDDINASFQAWLDSHGGADVELCNPNVTWTTDPAIPELSDGCGDTGSATVTFSFVDGCGNTGSTVATFNVTDVVPPEVVCPADLVLECGEDIDAINAWLLSASGSDSCTEATMSNDFDPANYISTCGDSKELEVMFTATDECGLFTSCPAKIIIQDPNAYEITCPADLPVDLDDPNILANINAWLEAASTDDPCFATDFEITNNFNPADLVADCDYLAITVTFTATNSCDVTRVCTAQILGNQDIQGVLECPPPLIIECGDTDNENIIDAWLATANAADFEGNEIILNNDFSSIPSTCETIEITFSGMDDCGQEVVCTSTIEVQDLTAPVIICPADLNLGCGYDQSAIDAWLDEVVANDGCQVAFVNNDFTDSTFVPTCGDSGYYEVNFTATDACGNPETCTARINIIDDSSITINCPDNLVVDFENPDYLIEINDWLETVVVNDACDLGLNVVNDFGGLSPDCNFASVVVNFEVSSSCGALASCSATLTGDGDTQPSLVCPEDISLDCGDDDKEQKITDWIASATGTDFLGNELTVANTYDISTLSSCGETIVEFSLVDACDNEIVCAKSIFISDNEAPQIICETQKLVDLSMGNVAGQIQDIVNNTSTIDDCSDDVQITHQLMGDVSTVVCGDIIPLEVIATDACGNESVCISDVEFIDFNEIAIDCPDPLSISCLEDDLIGRIESYLATVDVSTTRLDAVLEHDFDPALVNDDCNDYIQFDVNMFAFDECGNEQTCVVSVEILPEMKVFVPNIFTPDGDGLNDMVTVYANQNVLNIKEFFIYDRWGEVVFRGYDMRPNSEELGWDGKFKGRDADINVYAYTLLVEDDFGRERSFTGSITLMK